MIQKLMMHLMRCAQGHAVEGYGPSPRNGRADQFCQSGAIDSIAHQSVHSPAIPHGGCENGLAWSVAKGALRFTRIFNDMEEFCHHAKLLWIAYMPRATPEGQDGFAWVLEGTSIRQRSSATALTACFLFRSRVWAHDAPLMLPVLSVACARSIGSVRTAEVHSATRPRTEAQRLGVRPSTPGRSANNAWVEDRNCIVERRVAMWLAAACAPVTLWSWAAQCCANLRNFVMSNETGMSARCRRWHERLPGRVVPFGAGLHSEPAASRKEFYPPRMNPPGVRVIHGPLHAAGSTIEG